MIVKLDSINKYYRVGNSTLHVLKDIFLDIEQGELLAIEGPSGAGKSTLLHLIGGLDRPSEGKVYLEEEDIYSFNDSSISRIRNEKVGFVFQFYYLISELTVLENVALPLLIRGESKKKALDLAKGVLDFLKLTERVSHYPNQVSGGEQQRTSLARAIVTEPKILLCDEPTGNLDSQMGKEVLKLLQDINKERGTTIVVVTHDRDIASWMQRRAYMKDGMLVNIKCNKGG
ncbi:MAG: ABC transporter ATP-binding protein [Candidatus Saelkia tenebricola]|nr:ABC transporter ATP-binding protein [Candidatus Saelkia tenebricola]